MALAESIIAKLSEDAAVSAIVGSGATARVFAGIAPAGTPAPYAVFSVVASNAEVTHDASSDFDLATIQFTCVADTYTAARNLRKSIRGALTDATLAGDEKAVDFMERDGFSEAVDAYAQLLDVDIWHNPQA